jgi:hypothetical protein
MQSRAVFLERDRFEAAAESGGRRAEVSGNVMVGNAAEKRRRLADIMRNALFDRQVFEDLHFVCKVDEVLFQKPHGQLTHVRVFFDKLPVRIVRNRINRRVFERFQNLIGKFLQQKTFRNANNIAFRNQERGNILRPAQVIRTHNPFFNKIKRRTYLPQIDKHPAFGIINLFRFC